MPVSRPRAMLSTARSSGVPSRLLRSASVTNSSIWLPTVRVTPRTMAPVASAGVGPLAAIRQRVEEGRDQAELLIGVGGFGSPTTLKLGSKRSTVSVSIEWPKR